LQGNIFASSKSGVTSPVGSNFALLMMRAYLDSGFAPGGINLGFEAVPVDRLAEAVVAVSLDNGDCNRAKLSLTNPKDISLQEYVDLLSEFSGYVIQIIPFNDRRRKVIDQLPESNPLYPLTLYFHDGEPSEETVHFETGDAQAELARHGIEYPTDDRQLLRDAFDKTFRCELHVTRRNTVAGTAA